MDEIIEQNRPVSQEPPPQNYLVWAILATIFCCLPLGIVSIVFAAQVNSKWQSGDYAGARLASKNARLWALIALIAGIVMAGIFSIMTFVIGLSGIGLENLDSWH